MYCAFRQFPDQPGLYCTKEQFSALGTFSCFRNVVENPADLCSGEISIKYKAGFLTELFCQSFFLQRIAEFSSTTTLPDDCVADRIAGIFIPYDRCLALVRDTDCSDVRRFCADDVHSLHSNSEHACPDLVRIVLNPARFRKMLCEFSLCDAADFPFFIK